MTSPSNATPSNATPSNATQQPASHDPDQPVPLLLRGRVPAIDECQQSEFVDLVTRGAARATACRTLGISLTAVETAAREDPEFAALLDQAAQIRAQNVEFAMYKSALNGSVTAQRCLLKERPLERSAATPPKLPTDLTMLSDEELDELTAVFVPPG